MTKDNEQETNTMNPGIRDEKQSVESLVGQIADEFTERLHRGEHPNIEEYAQRYPEIAAILRQALPALQAVGSLAPGSLPSGDGGLEASPASGTLGDFRIVREIGRGGMGVVYEAEQISLGRRVALKVLPFAATLDAKQLQRFKNEAHAAAHLQHQNIVPVHFVGCERGVHFYAMQYVEGETLAALIQELRELQGLENRGSRIEDRGSKAGGSLLDFLRTAPYTPEVESPQGTEERDVESKLSAPTIQDQALTAETLPTQPRSSILDSRSSLFFRTVANLGIQAAEALEHAHQLGVIHRDIKPANMMVEVSSRSADHSPLTTQHSLRLWITDFGLAHCQGAVELTMTGDVVGTLRYMSPEQALSQRALVDQRTDIYSLGVTLYELLTLEPAFPGTERQELLRQIACDDPKPPRRLSKTIPPELETIVLKAIEKNPADRYSTAKALEEDLGRFLEDKPILAKRPTWMQRTRKWVRRHQSAVWAAGVAAVIFVAMAVGGLAISNVFIDRERRQAMKQRDLAEASFRQACQAVEDQLTLVSESTLFDMPGSQYLRKELLEAALKSYLTLSEQRPDDPVLQADIAATYFRLWQIYQSTDAAGFNVKAVGALDNGLQVLERLLEEYPDDRQLYRRVAGFAKAGRMFHGVYREPSDRVAVLRLHKQAAQIWEKFVRHDPTETGFQMDLAAFYWAITYLQAEPTERLQSARIAHELRAKVARDNPTVPEYQHEVSHTHALLGDRLLDDAGQMQEAEKHYRKALKIREKLTVECPTVAQYRHELSASYCALGDLLARTGRSQEAEKEYHLALATEEKVLSEYPRVPAFRSHSALYQISLADLLEANRSKEKEQLYSRARVIFQQLTAEFPTIPEYRDNVPGLHIHLGEIYLSADRRAEAAQEYQKAVAILQQLVSEFPREAGFRNSLAQGHLGLCRALKADRPEEAEQACAQALVMDQQLVADFPTTAQYRHGAADVHINLGDLYISTKRRAEAVEQHQKAITILRQLVAESRQVVPRHSLAHCCKQMGWLNLTAVPAAERAEDYRQAISIYEELAKEFPNDPAPRMRLATCWDELGELRRRNGWFAPAEDAYRRAMAISQQLFDESPGKYEHKYLLARSQNNLAWILCTRPDWGPQHAAEALEHSQKAVKLAPKEEDDFWHTLGVAHCRLGHWKEALAAIEKSRQLENKPGLPSSFDLFFEAMAYNGLGDQENARRCYDEGVQWMEKHIPDHADLRRFRAEAAQMLGIQDSKHPQTDKEQTKKGN